MKGTWHNNRISEKLNKEYKKDFSICDIDGAVRCAYIKNNVWHNRFIIYESKNEKEKDIGDAQLKTLKLINNNFNWTKFDEYSGVFIIKIIDLENELQWFNLQGILIRTTTFDELYNIFSVKQ